MKTNNYCIVKDKDLVNVEVIVNDLMDRGYIPVGNIYFYNELNVGAMWFQAMMKKCFLREINDK